jgi:hypothetical protein
MNPDPKSDQDPVDEPQHFRDDPEGEPEEEEQPTSAAPEDDEPHHFREDPTTVPGEEERDAES